MGTTIARKQAGPAVIWLLLYSIPRFAFPDSLKIFGPYGSYVFEGLFFGACAFWYRSRIGLLRPLSSPFAVHVMAALGGGFLVYRGAGFLGLTIPFNLTSYETLLFLLFIGPLIEELIFRQALWWPVQDLFGRRSLPTITTTAFIFAFAHFHAFFFVGEDLRAFVCFQSGYALLIGLWWGWALVRWKTPLAPFLLHLIFNLGFFLASW